MIVGEASPGELQGLPAGITLAARAVMAADNWRTLAALHGWGMGWRLMAAEATGFCRPPCSCSSTKNVLAAVLSCPVLHEAAWCHPIMMSRPDSRHVPQWPHAVVRPQACWSPALTAWTPCLRDGGAHWLAWQQPHMHGCCRWARRLGCQVLTPAWQPQGCHSHMAGRTPWQPP